jgi:hypothetical protein
MHSRRQELARFDFLALIPREVLVLIQQPWAVLIY